MSWVLQDDRQFILKIWGSHFIYMIIPSKIDNLWLLYSNFLGNKPIIGKLDNLFSVTRCCHISLWHTSCKMVDNLYKIFGVVILYLWLLFVRNTNYIVPDVPSSAYNPYLQQRFGKFCFQFWAYKPPTLPPTLPRTINPFLQTQTTKLTIWHILLLTTTHNPPLP